MESSVHSPIISSILSTFINLIMISLSIIIIKKARSEVGRYYGYFVLFSTGGFIVTLIKLFIIPFFPDLKIIYVVKHIIAMGGYRFIPFFLLMANLHYSEIFSNSRIENLKKVLLAPIFISYVIDFFYKDVIFSLSTHQSSIMWITSSWAILYVIVANILCLVPFIKNFTLKRGMVLIGNLFILVIAFLIYRIVKVDELIWEYIFLLFWFLSVIILVLITRYKMFGVDIMLKIEAMHDIRVLEKEESLNKLTVAEKELLDCVREGLTNVEIANKLFKSEETIKVQLKSIYKKLNVKSKTELKHYIK